MDYSHDEEVMKWLKKTNRKGPFYLLRKQPNPRNNPGFQYILIWKEKDKTKLGYLADGMYARYGINTMGVLNGTQVNGLWQSGPGSVSMEDLESLQRVAVGLSPIAGQDAILFDPATLESLKH